MFSELDMTSDKSSISPWVLKFNLDKVKMMDKNIRMADIFSPLFQNLILINKI